MDHSAKSTTEKQAVQNPQQAKGTPGSGTVVEEYPYSKVAKLLDSQLAHSLLKYGVETVSFATLNLLFPKRTSWVARVALPLAVNYVLGRWIEENYNEWVASLAQREEKNPIEQPAEATA